MSSKTKFQSVDEYMATLPKESKDILEKIGQSIREAVPEAEGKISYQLPAFEYHGMLIYYSAYKEHVSLSFPPPFTIFEVFRQELSHYEVSKTTIQFPMDQPIPYELIGQLAKYRAQENAMKAKKKK